jgi:molybdopterin-containing oxidoreductase family iron-sulfur binding subunit
VEILNIVYDAVSSSETLDAFEAVYGERALVDYDFSKASLIVSGWCRYSW